VTGPVFVEQAVGEGIDGNLADVVDGGGELGVNAFVVIGRVAGIHPRLFAGHAEESAQVFERTDFFGTDALIVAVGHPFVRVQFAHDVLIVDHFDIGENSRRFRPYLRVQDVRYGDGCQNPDNRHHYQ